MFKKKSKKKNAYIMVAGMGKSGKIFILENFTQTIIASFDTLTPNQTIIDKATELGYTFEKSSISLAYFRMREVLIGGKI